MAVDPRGADLKRLLAEDDDGPFTMLNLLRFADGRIWLDRVGARRFDPLLEPGGINIERPMSCYDRNWCGAGVA